MIEAPQWDRYQMVSDFSKSPVSANLAIEASEPQNLMQPDLGQIGPNRVIGLMDRAREAYAWAGSFYSTRICTARVAGAVAALGVAYIATKTASELTHGGIAMADVHHATGMLGVEVNGHSVNNPHVQQAAHHAITHAAANLGANQPAHAATTIGTEVNGHPVKSHNIHNAAHQVASHNSTSQSVKHAAGEAPGHSSTDTIGTEVNGKPVHAAHLHQQALHTSANHTPGHASKDIIHHNAAAQAIRIGTEVNGNAVHLADHHSVAHMANVQHQHKLHDASKIHHNHELHHLQPSHEHKAEKHPKPKHHHNVIKDKDTGSKKAHLMKRMKQVTLKSGDNPWTIAARTLRQAHQHITDKKIWRLDKQIMRLDHLNLHTSRLLSIGQKLKVPLD